MYTAFNLLKTTELTLIRQGLFFPSFELTDGQAVYGKISYRGFLRRAAFIETSGANYLVEFESFFSRTIVIGSNDELKGKMRLGFFGDAALMMQNGFEAEFTRDSVWGRCFTWKTSKFGTMAKLKESWFSFTKPIAITVDLNLVNAENMGLLCLLGSHLIILRKRRRSRNR